MIITRVERLRSRQPRYRVTFDDGEPIVLSEDLLVKLGLASGDELSSERLDAIKEDSERDAAMHAAYHYISYRPRSEEEVRRHLRKKGFAGERAQSITRELVRLNLVDDTSFAAMVVRDAINRGRTGPAGVRRKLAEKGIDRRIVDEIVSEYFTEDLQTRQALELLRKRVDRSKSRLSKLDPARRRARLYQFLCQRGFSSRTAMQALKSIEV